MSLDVYLIEEKEADIYLDKIRALIVSGEIKESFFSKTLGNLKVGEAINRTTKDINIQTEIKLGQGRENKGDFQGAIDHYKNVVNLLRNKGDAKGIKTFQLKIAVLLDSLNEHVQAQKFLNEIIMDMEKTNVEESTSLEKSSSPKLLIVENVARDSTLESLRYKQKELKKLAEGYALEKDF
jgi:hypothetical protein